MRWSRGGYVELRRGCVVCEFALMVSIEINGSGQDGGGGGRKSF